MNTPTPEIKEPSAIELNHDFGVEIVAALRTLKAQYPGEEVSLWVILNSKSANGDVVTGYIGTNRERVFGERMATPEEWLKALCRKAGDRNPEKLRQQKIAQLRDELAALETEGEAKA